MAVDSGQSTSPQEMRWLLPLLLTPLLLWGCWNAPFLELDDIRLIKNNPHLKSDAPWNSVFDTRMDSIYIPLTFLAFRVERNVGEAILAGSLGERSWPAAIRFGSLALNVLAALAVWKLLRALKASPKTAGFVAAACALHPTVCHSVCWPMEEKTMLSAMFGFAALALYVSAKSRFHYFAAAGLYVLALLAKPAALGLLPVALCWEFLGRPKLDGSFENTTLRNPRELLPATLRALPWIIASLAAIFMQTKMIDNDATLPPIGGSLFTVAMTDVPVLLRYIVNFIWPFGLSADYGLPAILSPADPKFLLSLVSLLLIAGATFFLAGKAQRGNVLFCWLWFVGALGPVLNFVGKNNLMADCYAYYSAPAIWLILALSVEGIAAKIPAPSRSMLAAVGIAAFSVFLSSLSAQRSTAFASTEALFEDSVRKEPQASLNHLLLAQILRARTDRYLAAGENEKHKETLHRELEELKAGVAGINFDRTRLITDSYIWLGRSYYENGKPHEAAEALEKARRSPQGMDRTRAVAILRLMGLMAFDRGDFEQSIKFYDSALGLEPAQSQIWLDRTRALLVLRNKSKIAGDSAAAEKYLQDARKALQAVPEKDPQYAKIAELFK